MATDAQFEAVLDPCPAAKRAGVDAIIELTKSVAADDGIDDLQLTTKWGQLSFVCKTGSTMRIGWQDDDTADFSLFFNCNSKLVEKFRQLHGADLNLIENRELVIDGEDPPPADLLAECIGLALNYHRVKHLPLLGA